jgi:hypothetical protein
VFFCFLLQIQYYSICFVKKTNLDFEEEKLYKKKRKEKKCQCS